MNKCEEIMDCENKYVMQTYGRFNVVIEKGKGSKLYDFNSKEYIDMTSGIGVSSLGYCNTDVLQALHKQIDKIMHTSNLYYNEPSSKLAKKLMELSGMARVFFANSGAEANEGAIKLARKYSFDKYGSDRNKIITLKKSFHGRTITTLEATGQDKFHKYFTPFTEGFVYVEKGDLRTIKSEILKGNICAIMMEAIQGEGGVFPLSKDFVQEVYKIAEENDVLIIFDEVQCGIGRTGDIFGCYEFDIPVDIITMAKGLGAGMPIGGVLCNQKLAGVLGKGDHGSTFGGNLISCAAALVVLDYMSKDGFLDEVKIKGEYINNKIKQLNSPKIKEIRGRGLMLGIDIDETAIDVVNRAIDKGLLLLTAGTNTLRLLPPLVITYEEIDKAIDILSEIL